MRHAADSSEECVPRRILVPVLVSATSPFVRGAGGCRGGGHSCGGGGGRLGSHRPIISGLGGPVVGGATGSEVTSDGDRSDRDGFCGPLQNKTTIKQVISRRIKTDENKVTYAL